ncbi:hypothetical protein BJ170DRAFT_50872 [Xylariales sp. AK1849]|nr:hypothetical protein BJ170DRAFT_50872 [Xylariales sp. AK1849]
MSTKLQQTNDPQTVTATVDVNDSSLTSPWAYGTSDRIEEPPGSEAQRYEAATAYSITFQEAKSLRQIYSDAEELRHELQSDRQAGAKPLIVIHGLPVNYVQVLGDELGIDAGFIEAIAGRRRYRHSRRATNVRTARYEYPELVKSLGFQPPVLNDGRRFAENMTPIDVMSDPLRYPVSNDGDQALLCHAALWEGRKASVLFLDRALWRDPLSFFGKPRYPLAVTKPCDNTSGEKRAWQLGFEASGSEVEGLEQRLWEMWENDESSRHHIFESIQRLVFEHWAELLEELSPDLQVTPSDFAALIWQIERSIVKNQDADLTKPDWQILLDRAGRTLRLAQQVNPPELRLEFPKPTEVAQETRSEKLDDAGEQDSSSDDANNQSLNRVSYLGGILLPLSIVSGILSMGDPFGPTGDMFYVYWVVSIPFTILTLLIIYADSIRKAEVWIEVAAEQAHDDIEEKPGHQPGKKPQTISTPNLEQGIPYSFSEPLPISDRIGAPATNDAISEVASEPPVSAMIARQKLFKNQKPKTWRKEQLGWKGACKTILQMYSLQRTQGLPPPGARL